MDTDRITRRVDATVGGWGPTALRWIAALLWLANVNWKVPPDFGRSGDSCSMLCRYVVEGAEHPVLPGSAWFFDTIAEPNLAVFGWITLLTEATLVALLVSGRFVRSAAVLGVAMSLGIGAAVANADGEWYWSYILMIALHLAILVTAPAARVQSARTMAVVAAGYGAVVALVHAGAGFTGDGDWHLFSQDNDLPGQWGRGTFPGSIAIGLVFVALGVAAWFADRLDPPVRRAVGWGAVGLAVVLLLTYRQGGLVVGLGSRPGNACLLAALGLALAVDVRGRSGAGSTGAA